MNDSVVENVGLEQGKALPEAPITRAEAEASAEAPEVFSQEGVDSPDSAPLKQ